MSRAILGLGLALVLLSGCAPSGPRGSVAALLDQEGSTTGRPPSPPPADPLASGPEGTTLATATEPPPPPPLPPPAPLAPSGPAPETSAAIALAFAEQNAATLAPVTTPATAAVLDAARAAGAPERGLTLSGRVQRLVRDQPGVANTGGHLVVAGTTVVIPKNLLFDLPVARLSLEELFTQAPEPFRSRGVSGIALEDGPPLNEWVATVVANRIGDSVVAGVVELAKRRETVEGIVTSIDFARGELRLNGDAAGTTGTRVRLNDPLGVASVQSPSVATGPGNNGSADLRCQLDPENLTVTAFTGYPLRVPSVDPALGDDPLAPRANRNPAIDSKLGELQLFFAAAPLRQAPILVGDQVLATGCFEIDPGPDQAFGSSDDVLFLSADTLEDRCFVFTRPQDPCYAWVEEALWVAPPFPLRRVDLLVVGRCTDPTSEILLRAVRRDPTTGAEHFELLGSTFSAPEGAIVLPLGRFSFGLSVDLGGGGGAFPPAPGADLLTLAREVNLKASNQNGLAAGTRWLNRGTYTTPVSVQFLPPDFNVRLFGQAWQFRDVPWLADGEGTPRSSGPLEPFPGVESRPSERTRTVRNGQLVSRSSIGLPSVP